MRGVCKGAARLADLSGSGDRSQFVIWHLWLCQNHKCHPLLQVTPWGSPVSWHSPLVRNLTAPSLWEHSYPWPAGGWPRRTAAKVLFFVEIQSKQTPCRAALMGWGLLFSIQAGQGSACYRLPWGCEIPVGAGSKPGRWWTCLLGSWTHLRNP